MADEIFLDGDAFGQRPVVTIHSTEIPTNKARYALQLAERFGVIAARDDGEDSAGRQKGRLLTPAEIAERACGIAEAMFVELEKRGWLLHTKNWDSLKEEFRAQKKADRHRHREEEKV